MADADKELPELREIYDELWSDARTMIKDMKTSINLYLFVGLMALFLSIMMIGTAISNWNEIMMGSASMLTYIYVVAEILGAVIYVVFGIALLYYHNKLKKRYAKLMRLEKPIGD